MKTCTLLFFTLILVILNSCDRFSKFPGFKKTKDGIYYHLEKIGDDTVHVKPGDYITIDLTYKTMNDSIFFHGNRKLQVTNPEYPGSIDDCFLMLAKDERATFIIKANDFFKKTLNQNEIPDFITSDSLMKITVEIKDVQTEQDYQYQKEAFLSWIEDFGEYEKVILRQFIQQKQLPVKPDSSGIYYVVLVPGNGKQVEIGDTVTVNYEGKFLNGKFFDSTIKRKQPFQFVYGTEWQVIKGLEQAIGMMHEGEKSLFILPSELGFGTKGSSTGIIPPFTSVIFEVELLKVSSPKKI